MRTIPIVPHHIRLRYPNAPGGSAATLSVGRRRISRRIGIAGMRQTPGASFGSGSVRCRIGHRCVPPSSELLGQNHPVIAANTGTAPYTTAHGLKIDPMNSAVVASAVTNGHADGDGNSTR